MIALELNAAWTVDCGGKKDYDGNIISITTRYWPAGGGFDVLQDGEWLPKDMTIKPSAKSKMVLWKSDGDCIDLASNEFEGDSFETIKIEVEAWAQHQYELIVRILADTFITISELSQEKRHVS